MSIFPLCFLSCMDWWLAYGFLFLDYFFILVRCIQYLDFIFQLDFYVYRFIYWYGDHSDRVTSDLVSISVIKSIYVLFCTIGGKLMGISESCRPFIIHLPCVLFVLFLIWFVLNLLCIVVCSVFCNEFLILLFYFD